jgi:hypothetical protein
MNNYDDFRKQLASNRETSDLKVVLRSARHELVSVHGLVVTRKPVRFLPETTWIIDVSATIALLSAAMAREVVRWQRRMTP